MLQTVGKQAMSKVAASRALRQYHASAVNQALSKFNMPAMSPTMTEGAITSWKKKPGESFASGDVLLELETDKAQIDVEAQEDGIMVKILAEDGSKGIPVGKPVAILGEEGDPLEGSEVDTIVKEASSEGPADDKSAEPPKQESAPEPPKEEPKKEEPKPAPKQPDAPAQGMTEPRKTIFATPAAKRIALERGVPLKEVKGTGPNGRILQADVEQFTGAASSGVGAGAGGPVAPSSPSASPSAAPAYTDIPVTTMRKVIADRLLQSKTQVPHYQVTSELKVDRLLKMRQVYNSAASAAQESGKPGGKTTTKISVNDFMMKAAALALEEVPEVNSSWMGNGSIRQHHHADISMAVATSSGLITPIIFNVGSRGLASISNSSKELAKRARDGKLKPEEFQGGSFTISNLGMFGSVSDFTAIINQPQSAILAVSGLDEKLVADAESEKGFKTIQTIKVTLSADHRIVDGAIAARWLKAFKDLIENPLAMML